MKNMKRIISLLMAFVMIITIGSFSSLSVKASDTAAKVSVYSVIPKKVRTYVQSQKSQNIYFEHSGDKITDLKTNSKNLFAKVTYKNDHSYLSTYESELDGKDVTWECYGRARITFYARKAGTYKVTFKIKDSTGKKTYKSVSMTVYASDEGAVKSVKVGKNLLYTSSDKKSEYSKINYLAIGKSGKISVKMNKGYKISAIEYYNGQSKTFANSDEYLAWSDAEENDSEVSYSGNLFYVSCKYNKDNGKYVVPVFSKTKNGKKIKYNTSKNEINGFYTTIETYSDGYTKYERSPMYTPTIIKVKYIDSYTKQTGYQSFIMYSTAK